MLFYPSDTRVQLVCHTDWRGMILPFAPVLALMAVCTYYAVLTRCSKFFFYIFVMIYSYQIFYRRIRKNVHITHYLSMSMTNEMMPKCHLSDLRYPRLVAKINNF